jgi:hypothetical protein
LGISAKHWVTVLIARNEWSVGKSSSRADVNQLWMQRRRRRLGRTKRGESVDGASQPSDGTCDRRGHLRCHRRGWRTAVGTSRHGRNVSRAGGFQGYGRAHPWIIPPRQTLNLQSDRQSFIFELMQCFR